MAPGSAGLVGHHKRLQGYGAPRLVGRHTLLAEARLRGGGGQTDKRGLGADVLKPIE